MSGSTTHQRERVPIMSASKPATTRRTNQAKPKAAEAVEPQTDAEGTEAEGSETKVGPLHEAHAAYIKRVTGKEVDPEAIFLVYSTRVAFRKTSPEYQEVGAKKAALKEEAEKARAEAKAKKAAEREEAQKAKEAEKAKKAEEREAAKKAKEEERAKAKAEKEAAAAKAKAEKEAASEGEASAEAKASDKATSKAKKGKAAF